MTAPPDARPKAPPPAPPAAESPPAGEPAAAPAPRPSEPPVPPAGAAERWAFLLYAGHLFTLFGIALSNALAALMILATPWALRRRRSTAVPAAARPLLVALGLYVLFLLVAIAASCDRGRSLGSAGEVFILSTLVLAFYLVRGERQVRWVVDGLVVVAALVAVAGLVQLVGEYGAIDRRIRGPFSHWMTFSGFLLICDLLLVARLAAGRRRTTPAGRLDGRDGAARRAWLAWRAGWRWAALAAINVALLASLTRSAWVGLLVAVTLLVVLRAPRLLATYPLAAVLFALLAPVPVLARAVSIFDLQDSSNYDRLCMIEAGVRMIAERPLFGLGPEVVTERYAIYRPPSARRFWVPHLHNSFLQLAAERGLPALAAFLAMMALSLAWAWRGFRREGSFAGPRADLYLGALLALIAFNVAGLFENNWGDTEVQRLALFVMALPFCLGRAAGAAPAEAKE